MTLAGRQSPGSGAHGRVTRPAPGLARRAWLVLACLVLLAGCGQPEPPPEEIARRAAATLDQLKSVHFLLSIEGAPAFLDAAKTLSLRQAEGDVLRPERAQATAKVGVGGFVVNVKFINIGDQGFMTDPLSGRWGPAPEGLGYNATYLFAADQGVASVIRQIDGVTKAGEASVDGVPSVQLAGEIATSKLAVLTGGVLPGDKVRIEVWVAKADSSVRQLRLTEIGAAKTPMTWTLVLSRHDQPVTIEPPR